MADSIGRTGVNLVEVPANSEAVAKARYQHATKMNFEAAEIPSPDTTKSEVE